MMRTRAKKHPFTTDKDLSSVAFWDRSFTERDETFAWLRRHAPVSWHPPLEVPGYPPEVHGEAGFWAVVRAADVAFASQNHLLFSSDRDKWGAPSLSPQRPVKGRTTFLAMDPPRHTRYRQVMSRYFTPKGIARLQGKLEERAARIVDRVAGAGEFDFVREVSAKLPMRTIADLVGVPEDQVEMFAEAGDNYVGANDPEITGGTDPVRFMAEQRAVLRDIGVALVADRRVHPADDLATALAHAEIDGQPLDEDDIENAMLLLSAAANDTTKQTTSQTVVQLWRNPEQKQWLMADYEGRIGAAIEEFVRYATPVMNFARVATDDVTLGGQAIEAGDKVALFYCSANRDEMAFTDPHRFDLTRPPAPHSAFGGGGVHYCLGNMLAKAQLKALFREILTKLPDMEVGPPETLRSNLFNGVRRLPVRAG
jgi:cytochrome P450